MCPYLGEPDPFLYVILTSVAWISIFLETSICVFCLLYVQLIINLHVTNSHGHETKQKGKGQIISTLSSASNGRWSRISSGSVSAAITTNSDIPLLRVLVAARKHKRNKLNNKAPELTEHRPGDVQKELVRYLH